MPSSPYLGEIATAGFNFAPVGNALCEGQTMSITQNTALFSLLGTSFGGNGTSTFALPDLRGRVVVSAGQAPGLQNYSLGQTGGTEAVALSVAQLPSHTHALAASTNAANDRSPQGNVLAMPRDPAYTPAAPGAAMSAGAVAATGSGQGHENRQPFLVMTTYIALAGVFPARS